MTRYSQRAMLSSLALIAGGLALATTGAFAQGARPAAQPAKPAQAQPAAPAAAPAQAPQGPVVVNLKADPSQEWTKVCGEDQAAKKTVCYTTRDFLETQSNQPIIAAAIYDVQNDPKKFVRMLMPLTFMLQPGVRFSVDNGQPMNGKFQICFPNGCFAEVEVNDAFITQMKKGTNLKIMAQNQLNNEVSFLMPLTDFAKGYDGPPIDPKVLEEQRKKLEEELKKRAEDMRKQQGAAPAAPAPAPAAPAAPAAPKQ